MGIYSGIIHWSAPTAAPACRRFLRPEQGGTGLACVPCVRYIEQGAERRAMFFRKFAYALLGIGKAIRAEKTLRFMLVCLALVIAAGFLLRVTLLEWAVLMLCCGAVLSAEFFNTAIERAVDLASPGQSPLAGAAKDIAAGAVLVISAFAALVALIIFLPHIIVLLSR